MAKVGPHEEPPPRRKKGRAPRTASGLRAKFMPHAKGETLDLKEGTVWIRKFNWEANTKPCAILCSGATGCALFYKGFAEKFCKMYNGKVLIWDRYNMGLSDRCKKHRNGNVLWESQLLQLMDALKLDKANLVGFSQGGVLTTYFAARHPNRVARMAMLAPIIGGMRGRAVSVKSVLLKHVPLRIGVYFWNRLQRPKLIRRCVHQVAEGGDPDGLPVAEDMYMVDGTTRGMVHDQTDGVRKHGCFPDCIKLASTGIVQVMQYRKALGRSYI